MSQTIRAAAFIDKGGTGKTTTIAHLGVALEQKGLNVLLIDLAGKQGDLAKHFGVWRDYKMRMEADDAWPNISTVFDDAWDTIAEKLGAEALSGFVLSTDEGPDLIPAHKGLDSLDAELGNIDDARDKYSRLERFLDEYVDPLPYDVVLLDLPGAANNVSYNGLWAARNVIVPVENGPFEAEQAAALRNDLMKISENFAVDVRIALVLPNKVDPQTNLASNYLDLFEDEYPEAVAPSFVPKSQDIRNAAEQGTTVFALSRPSKTARSAKDAYERASEALLEQLKGVAHVR